jgi:hypothetical protein
MTRPEGTEESQLRNPRLEGLRHALAVNRVMAELERIGDTRKGTMQHDALKRGKYLDKLYGDIHYGLYKDTERERVLPDPMQREKVREAILTALCGTGGGQPALFDSHGYVIHHSDEDLAKVLGGFYTKMRDIKPFEHGNELTLDIFMMGLGKLPAFKAVYDTRIDLGRLDAADLKALHSPDGRAQDVATAFLHAIDPARRLKVVNPPDQFTQWPNNSVNIGGIPFLSHKEEDGSLSLVTVNGGLVTLDDAMRAKLEANITSGKHLIEYATVSEQEIGGRSLPGTEALSGNAFIDGLKVTPDAVPLFCLDLDILTGLREQDRVALETLVGQVKKGATIFDMSNNESFRRQLKDAAASERLKTTVDIAYDHISRSTANLETLKDEILSGKTASAHPKLFMSMGGAGVGKSSVEEIAHAQCGDNFVVASLDEFRGKSDLHKVLVAANHHSDDYIVVDPFANTLRTWVANAAKEKGISTLYDGTGIDYQGRYDTIVADFKQHGFTTEVVAVDAPLERARQRVEKRFKTKHRALPWPVVVGKHVNAPRSFIQAAEDGKLDKLSLFANDTSHDKQYLVAESFVMADAGLATLRARQKAGTLAGYAKGLMREHEDSVLSKLSHGQPDALIARIPKLEDSNIAYLVYPSGGKKSVLVIYDVERFKQFTQKGMMNPHASSIEAVHQTPSSHAFLTGSWEERVCSGQGPGGVCK